MARSLALMPLFRVREAEALAFRGKIQGLNENPDRDVFVHCRTRDAKEGFGFCFRIETQIFVSLSLSSSDQSQAQWS
jgi:hypothetical protein